MGEGSTAGGTGGRQREGRRRLYLPSLMPRPGNASASLRMGEAMGKEFR